MFKSKAETLSFLQKNLKLAEIPKSYFFSASEWKKRRKKIILNIQNNFNGKIAIRSSAADEDSHKNSNAGKYFSFLNVNSKKTSEISKKVFKIINSYKNISQTKSQILIQQMVSSINCSGVVFNRDLNTGANYYAINYDDVTGKSDTVTSGNTQNSNRLLFVLKNSLLNVKSKRFSKLLYSIKEIEKIYNDIPLDIEFIISKKIKIYILQVRPLILFKKTSTKQEKEIFYRVENLKNKIKKKLQKSKTIFGQMPDWNPAEIIGKHPYPLISSLYKKLVLDFAWIKARKIMGYCDNFSDKKLMEVYLGQSFVDVRKSFTSFIPNKVPLKLQKKLVDYYVEKLIKNPSMHDKIEFEISINCFIFDFEKRLKKLCSGILSKNEIYILKKRYKEIFKKNLFKYNKGSIFYNLKKINEMKTSYDVMKSENDLQKIINYTIKNGIIPFSILARHAFVAENVLQSLYRLKIIDQNKIFNFKTSLETVTSKFLYDCNLLSRNIISFKKFKDRYGHLRPGTYDINSKNYSQIKKNFFINKKINEKNDFVLSNFKIKKINSILKKNNLEINYTDLFAYLKNGIESREYSKFIFTKYVDLILKKISKISKTNNLSKKEISFLKIDEILKLNKNKISLKIIRKIILKRKKDYKINKNIKLPILMVDSKNVDVIPFQVSSPNFIGNKKVTGKLIYIDNRINFKKQELNKKIVLIENADPGYDWLFNFNIKGLVTKFGGANSHMSIRCNELKVIAAIGVGEKIFEEIKNKDEIILDSGLKKIEAN